MTDPAHSIDPASVPLLPRLEATLHTSGEASILINGVFHDMSGPTDQEALANIQAAAIDAAHSIRPPRPVRLTLTDEQWTWPMLVTPDGQMLENSEERPQRVKHSPTVDAASNDPRTADAPKPATPTEPAADSPPVAQPAHPSASNGAAEDFTADHLSSASVPEVPNVPERGADRPTYASFLASRPAPPTAPANHGWRRLVRVLTAGAVSPPPSQTEARERAAVAAVQRSFPGPRTIMIAQPKGGVGKTPTTFMVAATLGVYRGGYVLAWDNNETQGTLGLRTIEASHTRTAVDLLANLDQFSSQRDAQVADLDAFVRTQGDAQFDVLGSDADPAGTQIIDGDEFAALHHTLTRFYRLLVIDTGNNDRAGNWRAALRAADQLVIPTTTRDDHSSNAAALIDALHKHGYGQKAAEAVTVVTSHDGSRDNLQRVYDHFGPLTRSVVSVPWEPAFEAATTLTLDTVSPKTRDAWLYVAQAIADGL